MQVVHHANEIVTRGHGVSLAIGMFDGVHLGHQHVLNHTVSEARACGSMPVAITFDRHPNTVVAPERTPPLIYPLAQRLRVISSLGIQATILIHFDRLFSQQPADAFIHSLSRGLGKIHTVCIGRGFTFGHKRQGNVALLKELGRELGFTVHDLSAVSWDGKVVSSTRIREAIRNGELTAAGGMLGRPYSIAAAVGSGEQLGQKLGFPTSNLDITGLVLPPTGVYAGWAQAQGTTYQAVANLGWRPTLRQNQPQLRFEVHLLGFSGSLYGQELEFTFVQALRPEQKFGSLEVLKEQIGRDVAAARSLLV
jgi:riboflavin kinase / FMN adenylyltransferase